MFLSIFITVITGKYHSNQQSMQNIPCNNYVRLATYLLKIENLEKHWYIAAKL